MSKEVAKAIIAAMPQFEHGLTPRWATVTSISPLRIRFDGEDSPLSLEPITLAGNLEVDDRVWCQMHAGQVFIMGTLPKPVVTDVFGSNANGSYEKYASGLLICKHSYQFPSNMNVGQTYTWTFPQQFVGDNPYVAVTPRSTVPQNMSVGYMTTATPLVTSTIHFFRTTAFSTWVEMMAVGRWK